MAPRKALKHLNTELPDRSAESELVSPAKRKRGLGASAKGSEDEKRVIPPARAAKGKAAANPRSGPAVSKDTPTSAEPNSSGRSPARRGRNPKERPIPKAEEPGKDGKERPAKRSRPRAPEEKAGNESAEKLESKPGGRAKSGEEAVDTNDVGVSTRTRRKNAQVRYEAEAEVEVEVETGKGRGKATKKGIDVVRGVTAEASGGDAGKMGKAVRSRKVAAKGVGRKMEKKSGPADKRTLKNAVDVDPDSASSRAEEENPAGRSTVDAEEPTIVQKGRKNAKGKVVGAPKLERPKARGKAVTRGAAEARNDEYPEEEDLRKDTAEGNVVMPEATKKKRGRGKVDTNTAAWRAEEDKPRSEESDVNEKVSANSSDLADGDVIGKIKEEEDNLREHDDKSLNKISTSIKIKDASSHDALESAMPDDVKVPLRENNK
ncbi:hypothetical protein KM043_000988 [Ampulex compressa]|nr:hypothetical protein KM043_000988 [Ampulex compressa]